METDISFWPFYLGGAAIGGVTLLGFWLLNKPFGVSSGFDAVCSEFVENRYFKMFHRDWRLYVLAGLFVGGFLSFYIGGNFSFTWKMGGVDEILGEFSWGKTALFFGGGILMGFGSRLANGCTSGHVIAGIPLGGINSAKAGLLFFAGSLASAWTLSYFVFQGAA